MRRLSLALMGLLAGGPAFAQSPPNLPPAVTVEGEASVSVVPDTALISLGLVTEREKAAEASAENSRAMAAVLDAVKAAGVPAEDVRTLSIGLSAVYDTSVRGQTRISGFRASNDVQIRVKPVDKAAALTGLLIDKGVNSLRSIVFLASPDPKRDDQLRVAAVQDARRKAEVYAGALGLKLGRVLAISPSGAMPVFGPPVARMMAPAPAVPLAAGSEEQRSSVSVTFEILQ